MIRTTTENYILSPILDHKEKYDLGGVEIYMAKDWENNLRRRNCQLGIVEALTPENPLNLCLGDIVFVHHFTFHGDIGADRSFTLNHHTLFEGKMLFKSPIRDIYFKYNNNQVEAINGIAVLEGLMSPQYSPSGLELPQTQYKDRGRIIYHSDYSMVGKEVLVESNALYEVELNNEIYYRVREDEIVAEIKDEQAYPTKGRVLLEDHKDDLMKGDLDFSMVKKTNTIKSTVIRTGELDKVQKHDEWIKEGDTVLRFRNYGIKFNNQVVVALADDNIHGIIL